MLWGRLAQHYALGKISTTLCFGEDYVGAYADDRVIVAEHREEMRGALVSKLQTKVISKLQNNVIRFLTSSQFEWSLLRLWTVRTFPDRVYAIFE